MYIAFIAVQTSSIVTDSTRLNLKERAYWVNGKNTRPRANGESVIVIQIRVNSSVRDKDGADRGVCILCSRYEVVYTSARLRGIQEMSSGCC